MNYKKTVIILGMCWGMHANAADTLIITITGNMQVAAKCNFDLSSTKVDLCTVDSTTFSGVGSSSPWQNLDTKSTG